MRNLAQRVPGGVFEKDVIDAIKTVLVVDEAAGFGRIGIFRRRNRSHDYLSNIHFPSRIVFLNFGKTAPGGKQSQSRGGGFGVLVRRRGGALRNCSPYWRTIAAAGRSRMPTSPLPPIKVHSAAMRRTTCSAVNGRRGGGFSIMASKLCQ
jgi:hypothetical protein